jgi:hypothetical protein
MYNLNAEFTMEVTHSPAPSVSMTFEGIQSDGNAISDGVITPMCPPLHLYVWTVNFSGVSPQFEILVTLSTGTSFTLVFWG